MELQDRVNLVRYRLNRAAETIAEVNELKLLGYYNTAVNRMYYACFYATIALLVANGIEVKSHSGVRNALALHFVKPGIIPVEMGKFYSLIFAKRSSGDYEDFFTHTLDSVEQFQPQAMEFVKLITNLVEAWLHNTK